MKIFKFIPAVVIFTLVQLILTGCFHKPTPIPKLGEDRIDKVIAAMTREEKIGMSVGDGK